MIENTFVHLPGVGPETEERLWSQGVRTWKDLADNLKEIFGGARAQKIERALGDSQQAHLSGKYEYFQERLKGAEMWRLFPLFVTSGQTDQIAYLDIETTGLGFPPQSQSTSIAVLFKGQLHLEHDPHRKFKILREIEQQAQLLVTFNGGTFDLPFLRREFGFSFRQTHLDLRYWLARLSYRGGLKKIQKCFPDIPQRESMDIDGFDAVRLWNLHLNGVPRALETLMTYNAEDTVVLEQLVYCALNIEAEKRVHLQLPTYQVPQAPKIPYQICPQVYRQLKSGMSLGGWSKATDRST
jgi:uncharacterized protein YprB with RNaseH-like and TPR domain